MPNLLLPGGLRVCSMCRAGCGMRGEYETAPGEGRPGNAVRRGAPRRRRIQQRGSAKARCCRVRPTRWSTPAGVTMRPGVDLFVTNLFDAVPVFGQEFAKRRPATPPQPATFPISSARRGTIDTSDQGIMMAGMDASAMNTNPPAGHRHPARGGTTRYGAGITSCRAVRIPFIIWLSLTGTIYLWRPQLEALLDRPYDHLPVAGRTVSPDAQVRAAPAAVPGSSLHKYVLPEHLETPCV
ncbi:MAG: hypothetical protein WKG07_20800 [Hymenobacter sp.]